MSRLDEYFAKANRGSQTTSSVSASGDKPASNMDAYFAKAGKPVRTNPLNLYTEALKGSQGQSTMQTPYADAAAQTKQSGTQNLYAQAAENAKKSGTNNSFLHGIAGIFEKAAAGAKEGLRTGLNEMGYRAQAAAPLNAADDAYYKAMWEQTTGQKTGVEVPKDTRTQQQKELDEFMGVADLHSDSARAMQRAANKEYERLDNEGLSTAFKRDGTYQAKVDERYADLGPKWQRAMNIAGSVGNQALPIIGRIAGTALLGEKGGEAFQSLLFFNQASGAAIEEALEDGASWDKALTYGTVIGSIEAATEAAGDMANKVTIKAAGKYLPKEQFTKALIGTLTGNKTMRTALTILGQMHGEGLEEVASDLVSPFAKSIYNGKTLGENWMNDVTLQGLWESYLAGAISGGFLSGIGGAVNGQFRAQNESYANETVNAKIEEARASVKENGLFNSETREKIIDAGAELGALETQQQTAAKEAREHMQMIREMQRALRGDAGAQERISRMQEGNYTAGAQNAPVGAQRAQNEVTIPQSAAPTAPFAQGSRNMEGEFRNGQSTYQGQENGSYDLRTGGQAAAEGGAQALAGGRAEIPGGVGADAQADLRQVTPAQLGIRNGGTEAVTVVDARKLGGDAARAYNLLAANNIEPVAVRGAIQVNNGYANAYTESGRVFFRVDAVDSRGNAISPEALVRHELFHNYISEEVLQASDEVIRESMTAEEYDAMYESYRDAYASIYDFENMSEDEIERLLTEEIAADAYAGLNWFSGDAPVQEAVRAETERNAPARRAEAQQETTGPPGKATAAGIGARTADSAALRRAEALEKSGTDNETIRQETGWYRGMDGQWRFEIDDSGATYDRNGEAQYRRKNPQYEKYNELAGKFIQGTITEGELVELRELGKDNPEYGFARRDLTARLSSGTATLRDVLRHDALFAAYPELAGVRVVFSERLPGRAKGVYDSTANTIYLNANIRNNSDKVLDVLLHEAQHGIQKMEGFESGASPLFWAAGQERDAAIEKYRKNRESLLERLSMEEKTLYDEYRRVEQESLDAAEALEYELVIELGERQDELRGRLSQTEWFKKLDGYDRILSGETDAANVFYQNTAGEIEARDTAARRRMSAEERKNTPPELGDADTVFADGNATSYSIDANFGKNVDDWVKNTPEGMLSTSHGYFRVGTTSEALKSIGARTDNIYMRKSKIGMIFEDHPEVTVDVIKKVPDILENPVLIMKSLTRSDSIVLLSEEKAENGNNLMVALELTPKPGGRTEAEFSLVTSAYGRDDENLRNLINNSELLYLDTNKNRANSWLMQLRVQFPSGQPPYGSIGNIAYAEDGVKITGKKLSELGGVIQKASSGKASVAVENRDSDNKKQGRKKLSEAEKYQNTTSKMAENRTVRNVAEYEKQISRMEKRLETGGQATLNEGGGNFYRVNIREENGEYYTYISDGKNVVAKHKSKAKMEAIRWAGDRMRAEIASRILYNPDTKFRGSYQSDLKRAENREYPVFKTESGTEVQTVPFWTWVQGKNGHYGLVVGKGINGAVRAWFPAYDNVAYVTNATTYAVEGDYENRTWNNDIVADVLADAEETAAARDVREEGLRKMTEDDQREFARRRKRDDTLSQINRENGRPMPNKGSGQIYRELMSNGESEVVVPLSMDNPKTLSYKVTLESDAINAYHTAKVMHNGHQIYKETGAAKEYVARDAAEFVDTHANRNFSEENFERAKKLEAEKNADEDARIAELFGDSEELAKQELTDKTVKKLTEKGRADEAEEYAARETISATTEKVTSEVIKAERNYREDFEKITSGAMRMFVNAGDTVRRIAKATGSKSLEGYYFNAGAYSQRAGNWIAKGGARTDIDGHRIGASLADTLAPMRKDATKYRDFQLYLLHMHNVDRMKYDNSAELQRIKDELIRVKERYPQLKELSAQELARVANDAADDPISRAEAHEMYIEAHQGKNPRIGTVNMAAAYIQELQKQRAIVEKQGLKPVFGYDVTADDSQTAAQLLEAKNPEFREWAKEVYRYSDDLIRYRVEAGLITREFADALKKRYPHYIPTFREEGTNSKRARSARRNGGIVVSNAIGRAVGSDGVLLPLHTALSRKTVSTMRNAGLNQFGLALVREHDGNKKATEKYIWDVAESEYTPTEAAIESDEDYKPVFENIFSVKENGKAYDITMDEGLTAAMKAFEPDKFANYGTAKAMKKLNDLFKALCTGYNPFFMIRNGVRDWQDAGFYSTDWKTWEKMYWSAWNQIRKNGEIWQQYKALGGSYASMLDYTTGMVKEPKNLIGKAAARYERLGQAIEAAPRLAEFMTILANKGGSKTADGVKTGKFTQSDLMEAMLGAADITTNFARGGTVTKMLNKYLVPFLNPSVQGFDKFIRNFTETRSAKAAASLILKAALINLPPLLLNGLMHGDDDDWDDIPASTKANYYLINAGKWFGNGYWIKIPKGRAIAVLSTAAVYTQEKQKGEDVKFSDVFEVIKSNVAPTDIFNQNIATAWTQAKLTNPDNPGTTWYGGNIESDRLQNYRPEDRYDEKTDELSKAIGKLFKVSPKKVNYLLDQYTGVIGDLLLPLITPATKSSHWLLAAPQAAFTIDTTSTNKTTGEYYDLLDDLKYDANDGDIGAGITRKYVSHAGDEVNDYYQQIRAIQNDKNLSDGEKNRLVRALKAQLIERQKEIIAQAEPYREEVNDYLKAHPELSTDNDAAIAEYAELYGITEDQAESRMDAIVYREANREVFGAEYALRTYNADVYDKARTAYAKGVSYETYYDYYFATKEMHADKDENGKSISGSKKAKVVEYINSLDIPPEQKDALYVAAGYTAKSAKNQKWNGGSGGSGGRRGRGKRTALKAPTPKAGKIVIPEASAKTASTAKTSGNVLTPSSKTAKASGNVIADFTKTASGTDIQKAVTQAKRKALKAGNRTVYVEEGSPIDYFLKYGKLPSLK